MDSFVLDIPLHVAEVLRHLPPDIKRPVKAALRAITMNPSLGSPLERELKGFWRFRVMAVAHRWHIYDDLARTARRG